MAVLTTIVPIVWGRPALAASPPVLTASYANGVVTASWNLPAGQSAQIVWAGKSNAVNQHGELTDHSGIGQLNSSSATSATLSLQAGTWYLQLYTKVPDSRDSAPGCPIVVSPYPFCYSNIVTVVVPSLTPPTTVAPPTTTTLPTTSTTLQFIIGRPSPTTQPPSKVCEAAVAVAAAACVESSPGLTKVPAVTGDKDAKKEVLVGIPTETDCASLIAGGFATDAGVKKLRDIAASNKYSQKIRLQAKAAAPIAATCLADQKARGEVAKATAAQQAAAKAAADAAKAKADAAKAAADAKAKADDAAAKGKAATTAVANNAPDAQAKTDAANAARAAAAKAKADAAAKAKAATTANKAAVAAKAKCRQFTSIRTRGITTKCK